jgi:hypothetical protein
MVALVGLVAIALGAGSSPRPRATVVVGANRAAFVVPAPEPVAPTTVVVATTTTIATTTTVGPPPTAPAVAVPDVAASVAPRKVVAKAAPPAATAAPVTAAPAPVADPLARVAAALASVVPAIWAPMVPYRVGLNSGPASTASSDGLITVPTSVASGSWDYLRASVAHEWGHLVAYTFGTKAFPGAAPAGWPYAGPLPQEAWADCVGVVLTGLVLPTYDLPPCPVTSLAFTVAFLAAGPH